jgi:hypothetical protein
LFVLLRAAAEPLLLLARPIRRCPYCTYSAVPGTIAAEHPNTKEGVEHPIDIWFIISTIEFRDRVSHGADVDTLRFLHVKNSIEFGE